MAFTPVSLKSTMVTSCKSTGISKSLLTPCRRLGLSRKVTCKAKSNTSNLNDTPTSLLNLSVESSIPQNSENITPLAKTCKRLGLSRKITPKDKKSCNKDKPALVKELNDITLMNTENEKSLFPNNHETNESISFLNMQNTKTDLKKNKKPKNSKKLVSDILQKENITETIVCVNKNSQNCLSKTSYTENIHLQKNTNPISDTVEIVKEKPGVLKESVLSNKKISEVTTTIKEVESVKKITALTKNEENAVVAVEESTSTNITQNMIGAKKESPKKKNNKKKFGRMFSLKSSSLDSYESDDDFVPLLTSSQKSNESVPIETNQNLDNLLECSTKIERIGDSPTITDKLHVENISVESNDNKCNDKAEKRKHAVIYSSEDEDFVASPISPKVEKKESFNIEGNLICSISLQKDSDLVPLETNQNLNNLLECSVKIERINSNPTITGKLFVENNLIGKSDNKYNNKSGKRKHAVVHSSDDEDFVASPITHKIEKKESFNIEHNLTSSQKISQLKADLHAREIRLKEKEKLLEELKRAETYKRLHNMDELQKSINIWKDGCKEALSDLLPKLKDHGDIDMPTLLVKLRIPEQMLKYDPELESFV